jgi:peptide deformylase
LEVTLAILKILTAGNSILKRKAREIETIDENILSLIRDMTDTMKAAGGLGLAANQVGILKRLVIVDFGYLKYDEALEKGENPPPPEFNPVPIINPVIESKEGCTSIMEGCLSVPGYRAEVDRALKINYSYISSEGKKITATAQDLAAIAIQHEIDHLDGILFIDRISNLKRNIATKKVRKYLEQVNEKGDSVESALYGKS